MIFSDTQEWSNQKDLRSSGDNLTNNERNRRTHGRSGAGECVCGSRRLDGRYHVSDASLDT